MNGARILLVEDDPAIARSIIFALDRDGLRVTHSLLLTDARRQLALAAPALVILDVGLPDGNGLDFCRELRASAAHAGLPVLMLSAHGEEIDRVLGLELGADDYVTKPFSHRELVARIRAVLRRGQDQGLLPGVVEGEGVRLDVERHRVSVDGVDVRLALREFELLELLLRNAGRVMTRGQLIDRIWGSDYVGDTKTLDVHVKRLRAKIEQDPSAPQRLVTVRGLGYKFEM